MSTAKVQERGQVTVPREIRERCGIVPGSTLVFRCVGDGTFECEVLPPTRSLIESIERFQMEGVAPDLDQLREEMGDEIAREHLGRIEGH